MANSDSRGATSAPSPTLDLDCEVGMLNQMTIGQLRRKYEAVFGETTAARHRTWLIRRIAWRLQANAYGGLSERAIERARELANFADLRTTPPLTPPVSPGAVNRTTTTSLTFTDDARVPLPGSTIVRQYKGQNIVVRVMPNGFEHDGQLYASLSGVAKKITGSHVNGFHFFKIKKAEVANDS